ncbi:MAG: hypothetical protein KJO86_04065, partial [Muriicola sp.]|nr:hypothetical protein [Muriicola sp.]
MKKLLFALLVIVLLIVGVFHKQILATIDFYQYQQNNADTFTKATINWKQMPFTSTGNSGVASESLTFASFQFPIPFPASKKLGDDAAFAFGGTKSISIAR